MQQGIGRDDSGDWSNRALVERDIGCDETAEREYDGRVRDGDGGVPVAEAFGACAGEVEDCGTGRRVDGHGELDPCTIVHVVDGVERGAVGGDVDCFEHVADGVFGGCLDFFHCGILA